MRTNNPVPMMKSYLTALAIILLSVGAHVWNEGSPFSPIDNIASSDPGEYRYVAEFFFAIPHDRTTYAPVFFETSWGLLLETVPLREIGVGTAFLIAKAAFGSYALIALPVVLKLLLIASYVVLFAALSKRYGRSALVAIALTVFPLSPWDFTEVLFSEAFVRILFLVLIAASIAWDAFDRRLLLTFFAVGLLLPHFKIQWLLLSAIIATVIVLRLLLKKDYRRSLTVTFVALLIPISIVAVHMRWDYPKLTIGTGLHTFHKARSDAHQALCVRLFGIPPPEPFCSDFFREKNAGWIDFSNAWTTKEDIRLNVERLDREVIGYHLRKPTELLSNLFVGSAYAKNVPYAERPWNLLLFPIDMLCWMIMLFGLSMPKTRFLSLIGLSLWAIPAIGYVFQVYHDRYHVAMAGLPLMISFLILVELKRGRTILPGTRASTSGIA